MRRLTPILAGFAMTLAAAQNVPDDVPEVSASSSFRMPIADVFTVSGEGLIATGRIDSGGVSVGDRVCVIRASGSVREVTVESIESFRRVLESATAGDQVGLSLRGVERADVSGGDVVSACP